MMLYDNTFRELDRLSDAFFSALAGTGSTGAPVNLRRESDRYVLEADLPGYDPQSIDVSVDGQWLTIRAERSAQSETEKAQWLVRERSAESTVRQFALGQDVDVDAITADYQDGVLKVVLPVLAEARPRKIAVGSSPTQQSITTGTAQQVEATHAAQPEEASAEGKAQPAHSFAS
ncbi:Hsp20/alpha crystallin family protein [Gryllotalpicola ginsengisoli]|uniref:Hsp20/alpha crystallin family protein n=1 Tax=Gryllotalpicola ginsengisoli TaxID=444608 RepID=UPI0003B4CA20|nr:Hsp20/alpha crystallin family protein [Gryllotalpicola ginsengisoli]